MRRATDSADHTAAYSVLLPLGGGGRSAGWWHPSRHDGEREEIPGLIVSFATTTAVPRRISGEGAESRRGLRELHRGRGSVSSVNLLYIAVEYGRRAHSKNSGKKKIRCWKEGWHRREFPSGYADGGDRFTASSAIHGRRRCAGPDCHPPKDCGKKKIRHWESRTDGNSRPGTTTAAIDLRPARRSTVDADELDQSAIPFHSLIIVNS